MRRGELVKSRNNEQFKIFSDDSTKFQHQGNIYVGDVCVVLRRRRGWVMLLTSRGHIGWISEIWVEGLK
jgi:hypothetical protein